MSMMRTLLMAGISFVENGHEYVLKAHRTMLLPWPLPHHVDFYAPGGIENPFYVESTGWDTAAQEICAYGSFNLMPVFNSEREARLWTEENGWKQGEAVLMKAPAAEE